MHANTKIDSVQNDRYMLFYYQDRTDVQYNYLDNAYQIARIKDILSRSPRIDSIVIYAYSSPEGSPKRNKWLAERRAETAKQFILNSLPNKNILHPNNILLRPMGENWEGLEKELEANYHLLNRDRVMKIIRAKVPTETKKWRLQQLDNGFTYKWIIQHHMPELRVATWICVYVPMPEITEKSMSVEETLPPVEPQLLPNALPVEVVPIPDFGKKRTLFALKTNLLYDALLVPNLGFEAYIGKGYSISANAHFAWWNSNSWFWRTYGGEISLRKWFGEAARINNLTGHHIGLYSQVLTYDFMAFGIKGYMSAHPHETLFDRPLYTVGLEYGYSLPIARNLNLDFVLGVGFQNGQFNEYKYLNYCHVWQAYKQQNYFGPTKAEISLTWLLKSSTKKKGGAL